MRKPLFASGDAPERGYCNIRDAKDGPLYSARSHCEYLWTFFQHHADPEFEIELRSNFNARYWEMYLTVTLICAGYSVTCPKPGPDVGIIHRGKRIWFEAVSPGPGKPGTPDYIPPPEPGKAYQVPNEKIVLRYLNSISGKYDEQYANWIAKGIISKDDAFVVALNPRNIPFEHADTEPPRILQAAYTVGPLYAEIDRLTLDVVRTGFHFRDHIKKTPKETAAEEEKKDPAKVTTGVFQDGEHNGLSGLLCSRVEVANRRGEFGSDFQLVPNPHARVPLPESFRLKGDILRRHTRRKRLRHHPHRPLSISLSLHGVRHMARRPARTGDVYNVLLNSSLVSQLQEFLRTSPDAETFEIVSLRGSMANGPAYKRYGIFPFKAAINAKGRDALLAAAPPDASESLLSESDILSYRLAHLADPGQSWVYLIQLLSYRAEQSRRKPEMAQSLKRRVREIKESHKGDFEIQARDVMKKTIH